MELKLDPDPEQEAVLAHRRGSLLVAGPAGTGKTTVLTERFARLVEEGADPERVALVVGSRRARARLAASLLERLRSSLPTLRVLTMHGLAFHVVNSRFGELDYSAPPEVLSAPDQFSAVHELLQGDDLERWPAYSSMLRLRGFADEVRQFLLRAQEALLTPDDVESRAEAAGLSGWKELAAFYRRYLEVLDGEGKVDFAGLVTQAAAAAGRGEALFDHLLVDDYHDATYAGEALVIGLRPQSLVVAGTPEEHVFSFRGTTDVPIRQFRERAPAAERVELRTNHRGEPKREAWWSAHSSEERAAVARELRRIHVEEGVSWNRMAVVVRRQGTEVEGILRALKDAGVPRSAPEQGVSAVAEPGTYPFVLALRWASRPHEREALIESILTSELARLAPATARDMRRRARAAGRLAADALEYLEGLDPAERAEVEALRDVLAEAEAVAARSVLDAFSLLWRKLPYAGRLVTAADHSEVARRDLDAVLSFSEAVSRAGEEADPSVEAFLERIEAGQEGPGYSGIPDREPDEVQVLTAHGSVGREFHTVVVAGSVEGDFPSLSRPEPMFDLDALERLISQSERNRIRLEDERRLFRTVAARASHRVLFTASELQDETGSSGRSRFVDELGSVRWEAAATAAGMLPLTSAEAQASWRRTLADPSQATPVRLAALDGLASLGLDASRWWFGRKWTDTGRPLHEDVRVSFSRLETLENCELQYVLGEELGLGSPSGYHAWVGHLAHRLIEDCENGAIPRSLEALVQAAEERWQPEEFPSYAVSEAFRRLLTRTMLPNWFRGYGDSPAAGREVRFTFGYDGATVTGYIDRIAPILAGGYRITDYKTGKREKAGKAEDSLQLGMYYLAVEEAEELAEFRPIRAVELSFLRGSWNNDSEVGRLQRMWGPERNEEQYRTGMRERLSGLIERIRALVKTETYRPNPAADCHFCEFKTLCPLWPEGAPMFPEQQPEAVEAPSQEVPA